MFQNGARASTPAFRVAAMPGTGLVGFATTKKIGCHARRNRARRRARAAFNEGVSWDVHWDIVIVVREPALDAPMSALADEVQRAVEGAKQRWDAEPGSP